MFIDISPLKVRVRCKPGFYCGVLKRVNLMKKTRRGEDRGTGGRGGGATRIREDTEIGRFEFLVPLSPRRPVASSPSRPLSALNHSHTRFTSVRKPTPVGPTAR